MKLIECKNKRHKNDELIAFLLTPSVARVSVARKIDSCNTSKEGDYRSIQLHNIFFLFFFFSDNVCALQNLRARPVCVYGNALFGRDCQWKLFFWPSKWQFDCDANLNRKFFTFFRAFLMIFLFWSRSIDRRVFQFTLVLIIRFSFPRLTFGYEVKSWAKGTVFCFWLWRRLIVRFSIKIKFFCR